MIPERIYELRRSSLSVTSEFAKNPQKTPGEIAADLFPKSNERKRRKKGFQETYADLADTLKKTEKCGKCGPSRPSDLFLQVGSPSHVFAIEPVLTGMDHEVDIPRCTELTQRGPHGWDHLPVADGKPRRHSFDHYRHSP